MSYPKNEKKEFTLSIPKGVTLKNCFSYITAIEEAVEGEIDEIPLPERRLVLTTVHSSLQMASQRILRLIKAAEAASKQHS